MFLKISVPILTIGALLWHGVHAEHFSLEAMEDTGPILSTLIAGGVIYGFNGCQMIVNFTAEAKAPHKSIPLSMFLALLIALLVYLALQFAFINAAVPAIDYKNPFVELVLALGLGWLAIMLQVDAALSPSGTGFIYIGSCTRMLSGMSRSGQVLRAIGVKNKAANMSHRSLWVNALVAIALFLLFQS